MKGLILSFFAVLLAYSLFVDDKAETVDKTLLPLDSAIQMKKVDVWQDTIPLTTPLKVISPVARTDAESHEPRKDTCTKLQIALASRGARVIFLPVRQHLPAPRMSVFLPENDSAPRYSPPGNRYGGARC